MAKIAKLSKIRAVSGLLILTVRCQSFPTSSSYFSQTMGSKNLPLIFATIVFFLFLNLPSQTQATFGALVSKVCMKSDSYKSCVQVLISHPQTLAAHTVKQMAGNALELAKKDAIATSNFFTGLASTIPGSKPALVQCAAYFKGAVMFLNLKGLQEGSASLDVHYALDQAGYCETALSAARVRVASATDRIQKWKNVFSAAYAAVITVEN